MSNPAEGRYRILVLEPDSVIWVPECNPKTGACRSYSTLEVAAKRALEITRRSGMDGCIEAYASRITDFDELDYEETE